MDQVCFRDGGYSPFPVSDWSHCIFRVLCKSNSDTTYGSLTKVPVQWFLELWDASHAVLGIIAIIAIQRAIQKILISVFLSREYKHDETNRAWWTGKWYGRGLGNSAMSQPAREFIVKIVEMSLWSGDFLLAHVLLMILTPPILIPFIDKLHSTMLCKFSLQRYIDTKSCILIFFPVWLRPSKQIRAPLFSTKQKRQRRWIVSFNRARVWALFCSPKLSSGC